MVKLRILKIKVGSVFINGKNHDVFQDAWEKRDKKGNVYFEIRNPVFVQEVQTGNNKQDNSNDDEEEQQPSNQSRPAKNYNSGKLF